MTISTPTSIVDRISQAMCEATGSHRLVVQRGGKHGVGSGRFKSPKIRLYCPSCSYAVVVPHEDWEKLKDLPPKQRRWPDIPETAATRSAEAARVAYEKLKPIMVNWYEANTHAWATPTTPDPAMRQLRDGCRYGEGKAFNVAGWRKFTHNLAIRPCRCSNACERFLGDWADVFVVVYALGEQCGFPPGEASPLMVVAWRDLGLLPDEQAFRAIRGDCRILAPHMVTQRQTG